MVFLCSVPLLSLVSLPAPGIKRFQHRKVRIAHKTNFKLFSFLPMGAAEVKAALNAELGTNAKSYWRVFSNFLSGRAARAEFEDSVRQYLNTPQLGESPVLEFRYGV
jgi:hypothetical protein